MTVAELIPKILKRLGDTQGATVQYYTNDEVLVALNTLQRFFVQMTLCLEKTDTFAVTTAPRYRMLTIFPDWIAPLRIRISGGARLKPARLQDLSALDTQWSLRPGTPERYSHTGFDLLGIYKQAVATMSATYARCPVDLTMLSTPEIPAEYHPSLIDGAPALMRVKEGQQEWEKTLPDWSKFMDAVSQCGEAVRARSRERGFDAEPPELKRYDKSREVLRRAG